MEERSAPEPNTGCFIWFGSENGRGYGQLSVDGKRRYTHRLAWEMENGPIPPGAFVLHKCDNPSCINPDHLFLGTHNDNVADMWAKGRAKTPFGGKGEQAGHVKLTEEQVLEIRALHGKASQREIAEGYKVSQGAIWSILNRKSWAHLPASLTPSLVPLEEEEGV